MTARVLPCSRAEAQRFVREHHSHHEAHLGELFAQRLVSNGSTVAVVVVGRPVAPELDRHGAWEVTRLAVGPVAPHCAASMLLGAAWKVARVYGCRRLVSYTRSDEAGTCYRAAGWVAVATVKGRPHTTGNRSQRHLPGLYEPSTEIVDRVRWEIGPDAARTRVEIAAPAVARAAS